MVLQKIKRSSNFSTKKGVLTLLVKNTNIIECSKLDNDVNWLKEKLN